MEDALQKNFRWILRSGIICGSNFIYSMLQEISASEVHILTVSFQTQIYSSRKMHRFAKNLQILWEGSLYNPCESPMSEYTILNATVCIFSCPGRVLIASSVNVDFRFSIHSLNSTNSSFYCRGYHIQAFIKRSVCCLTEEICCRLGQVASILFAAAMMDRSKGNFPRRPSE